MTGFPLVHRYCGDHTPSKSLCGLDLGNVELLAAEDEATILAAGDPCLVCADLSPQACSDACLGARREATA